MNADPRRSGSVVWRALCVSIVVSLVLALVGTAATQTLAQDGPTVETEGVAPEVDPPPVILNRTVSPDGTTNTTIELPITADTYIASDQPNSNFGSSTWLRLGYSVSSGFGAVRILLNSEISRIPADADINRAVFRIYQHTVTFSPGDPTAFGSRHLNSPWNEYQVTWNSHQPDWGGVIATSDPGLATGWVELDITELIREVHHAAHPDYGVTLLANETPTERQRIFYSREAGNGLYPRIRVEYTDRTDNEPPNVSVEPLPAWSPPQFTVRWGGDDPGGSGIDHYDIEYRITGQTSWVHWLDNTEATSAVWAASNNGTQYEFRARGVDNAGNIQPWPFNAQASTRVDAIPPTAGVNSLPGVVFSPSFVVTWGGSDNPGGSGLKHYDVQWRVQGGAWDNLILATTSTSFQFTGGNHNARYEFRARAVDVAGNAQPWNDFPQASTIVDVDPPTASVVPFFPSITGANLFTVQWTGQSSPNTSIASYDVRVKFGQENYTAWLSGVTQTNAQYTNLRTTDGSYCFQARARDSAGRTGEWSARRCIIVDRNAPFVEPRSYLPVEARNSN